jgi:hypothetical protein
MLSRKLASLSALIFARGRPALADITFSFTGNLRTDATFASCGFGCTLSAGDSEQSYAQFAALVLNVDDPGRTPYPSCVGVRAGDHCRLAVQHISGIVTANLSQLSGVVTGPWVGFPVTTGQNIPGYLPDASFDEAVFA